MNSGELLEKLVSSYQVLTRNHREDTVRWGQACEDFIVSRRGDLAPPRNAHPHVMARRDWPRKAAVGEISERLSITRAEVTRAVQVAAVVRLLGPPGELSLDALRAFLPAIGRGGDDSWVVRPSAVTAGIPRLYHEAAAASWTGRAALHRVTAILGSRRRQSRPAGSYKRADGSSILAAARAGTPRDVAALCLQLVEANPEPIAVVTTLLAELERLRRRPPVRRLTFADAETEGG